MPPQGSKHVLLVEDDLIMGNVLRHSLRGVGLEVTVARNGLEAHDMCRQQQFDAVVTDYQMPKMNGEEFVRRLRQGPVGSNVPVIFVTGKGLELDTERLQRDMAVFAFISKPFGPRHLIEVVQKCLAEEPETTGCRSTRS